VPPFIGDLLDVRVPRAVRPQTAPTSEGSANTNILFELIEATEKVPGNVAECGVFRASTLLAMGLHIKQRGASRKVFGFDSFQGFDKDIEYDLGLGGADLLDKRIGGFGDTSLDGIRSKVARLGLEGTVHLQPGYFKDSLEPFKDHTFSFVHLDCDIYESYRTCLEFFYPRVPAGGVILFDEYNDPPWPGCNKAVDGFLADKPEKPIEITRDNYRKWYIQLV
jgi:O-methyltransferase